MKRLTKIAVLATAVLAISTTNNAQAAQSKWVVDAYYSQSLGASFTWKKLPVGYGHECVATIVGMDYDSPLHQIGLRPGDGILKMDGRKICLGKYQLRSQTSGKIYYALPELDQHWGRTSVEIQRAGLPRLQTISIFLGN